MPSPPCPATIVPTASGALSRALPLPGCCRPRASFEVGAVQGEVSAATLRELGRLPVDLALPKHRLGDDFKWALERIARQRAGLPEDPFTNRRSARRVRPPLPLPLPYSYSPA